MFFGDRIWKKSPKAEGIASIGLDQVINGSKTKFVRWKVHGDWVQQVERPVLLCVGVFKDRDANITAVGKF